MTRAPSFDPIPDTGCARGGPSCLSCVLPRCVFDPPATAASTGRHRLLSPEQEDALYRDYCAMAALGRDHIDRSVLAERYRVSPSVVQRVTRAHRETETALQIVLSTGSFVPGTYEAGQYDYNWKLVEP